MESENQVNRPNHQNWAPHSHSDNRSLRLDPTVLYLLDGSCTLFVRPVDSKRHAVWGNSQRQEITRTSFQRRLQKRHDITGTERWTLAGGGNYLEAWSKEKKDNGLQLKLSIFCNFTSVIYLFTDAKRSAFFLLRCSCVA